MGLPASLTRLADKKHEIPGPEGGEVLPMPPGQGQGHPIRCCNESDAAPKCAKECS